MTKRKNVQLSEDIEKKLAEESLRIGVSQSNIISIALDYYFRYLEFEKNKKYEIIDAKK